MNEARAALGARLGSLLRRHRLLQDRTQVSVARALDVSQSTYNELERGRVFPSFELLIRLLRELDISAEAFQSLLDGHSNGDDEAAA